MAAIYYLGSPLFAFVFNIFLFIVVRIHGAAKRQVVHAVFSFLLLSMALWGISIFAMRSSPTVELAHSWEYLVLGTFALVSIAFFHFVLLYTETRASRFFTYSLYLVLLPALALLPLSPLLLRGMQVKADGHYALQMGPLFLPWVFVLYALVGIGLVLLVRMYRRTRSPDQRNRLSYLMVGTGASLLGATSDYVFAAGLLPQPGGIIGNIIWAGCCTMSMTRYRLLGVRMVLRKAIGFAVASVVAILPFAVLIYVALRVADVQRMSIPMTIVLLAALALVAQPLLSWTQEVVNRWFYRRRYDIIEALRYFSERAKFIRDLDSLVSSLARLLSASMETEKVSVYAHFPPNYVPVGYTGVSSDELPVIPEESIFVQWLAQHDSTITREEMEEVPSLQALTADESTLLEAVDVEIVVPMRIEEELVGVILIGAPRTGRPYSAEDLDLLGTVANQAALSLEGARLLAVERERVEQIRRSSELRSDFLVTIAHELKTPVTVIKAALEMLEELGKERVDGPDAVLTGGASRNVRALENLVNDLMTFAKARHQTLEIDRRPIGPKELLKKVQSLMEPLVTRQGQTLEVFIPPGTPVVSVDPDHFSHIINNLVSNAIKYTPKRGTIRLGLWVEDSNLTLTVADTGTGIPEEDLPWIFEPYRRARGALDSAAPRGSGLGLAITKALVELHGGTIQVASKVGEGSTFTVSIPLEVAHESVVY